MNSSDFRSARYAPGPMHDRSSKPRVNGVSYPERVACTHLKANETARCGDTR